MDSSERLTWAEGPVELHIWKVVLVEKYFLKHEPHPPVVRLLIVGELVAVTEDWIKEFRVACAEISWLGLNLVLSNVIELVSDRASVVDPGLVGVYAENQEVNQRNQVISSS